ncbi:sensor histidine kinase [Psychromicrobium sp. YIM B11713]|uniref:sensor histidine kinase n=1 Tax=Psychromicrobium sp. YIM B11713 TaxID=3145233 RepID=UPI00374F510B
MEFVHRWVFPQKKWMAVGIAALFFALWIIGEAGRMYPGFLVWSGFWPLVLITLAIGVSALWPVISLSLVGALLILQLGFVIPVPAANHWAIYLGSFFALTFILWTAPPRIQRVAGVANLVYILLMSYLMMARRYGAGVGWLQTQPFGAPNFRVMGLKVMDYNYIVCAACLLAVTIFCASLGLLMRLYENKYQMMTEQAETQEALQNVETELTVQQERVRISRDLHDVLAHSLAVIAAQADGTRYASIDQPKPVIDALENIASSARRALLDAQLVIEGTAGDDSKSPQPGLQELTELLEQTASGNVKLNRLDSGEPQELATGQQVAVYRIVQEGTANALKHGAPEGDISVYFDWKEPGLLLRIVSTLPEGSVADDSDTSKIRIGKGLPGMQERAKMAGGWLSVQRDETEGLFRLTAFIPYPAEQKVPVLLSAQGGGKDG